MMSGGKVITVSFYVLLGAIISSVQANPVGRQVGLSTDVQVLTVNGTEVCQVGGNIYQADADLPTEDPCEYCTCQPPGLACEVIKCSYKPGCRSLQRAGLCCPEFICDCEYEGKIYQNGDRIKKTSNPCEDCYCITGEVKCSVISCSYPPSISGDCVEVPVEGECCPTYNCSQPLEEETATAFEEIPSTENIEQQEDTQESSHQVLEEIPVLPTESQTVIESDETKLQAVPEEEETEIETENSIFIQILPFLTSTIAETGSPAVEPTEIPSVELTEEPVVGSTEGLIVESTKSPVVDSTEPATTENNIEITDSMDLAEQVTTENQPETIETTTFVEDVSETSTKLVSDDELSTESIQTTIPAEEATFEPTEESTTSDRSSDSDIVTASSTLDVSEMNDVSVTDKEILTDLKEITAVDKSPLDTAEPVKEETKLPLEEISSPSEDEIEFSELGETFSIFGDSDTEAAEFIASEPAINPKEVSSQDEKSNEIVTTDDISSAQPTEQSTTEDISSNQLPEETTFEDISSTQTTELTTEDISSKQSPEETTFEDISSPQPTEQSTADDLLISTTTSLDISDESEKIELTTLTDISNEPTTFMASEITELPSTTNADELTTEFKESVSENPEEYWTSLLNYNVSNVNENVKESDQHISAPANKIEKYDNIHENKIDKDVELFAAESELVIDEEPFVQVATLSPQEFATTEKILEQTTKLPSYEETTTEVQTPEDVTTDIPTTEFSSEDKFKSDIIEFENDQFEQDITSEANDETTTESVSEVTHENLIQTMSDEITTNISEDKNREDDTKDYWSKMTMGKNNPIEVMKEIAKIAESSVKENSKSELEEAIMPDVRSDIENIESSTLHYDKTEGTDEEYTQESETDKVELTTKYFEISETTEEAAAEYTQESVTNEVELTTKYAEEKETVNEEAEFENVITTVSTDELTSDISVDNKFRNNINDEVETSTQLNEEYVTSKYQAESETTDTLETTESSNEFTTLGEELIKDYVTARSETESISVDEKESTAENTSLNKIAESNILDKNDNIDETKIENSSEEILNKNETVEVKTDEENNSTQIESKKITKESDIHVIDKILSNGSVTKIETHTSEGRVEEAKRKLDKMDLLRIRYRLRPLRKRVIRDPLRKPKVKNPDRQTRKSFLRRRQ